jgi:hypothetical protein
MAPHYDFNRSVAVKRMAQKCSRRAPGIDDDLGGHFALTIVSICTYGLTRYRCTFAALKDTLHRKVNYCQAYALSRLSCTPADLVAPVMIEARPIVGGKVCPCSRPSSLKS